MSQENLDETNPVAKKLVRILLITSGIVGLGATGILLLLEYGFGLETPGFWKALGPIVFILVGQVDGYLHGAFKEGCYKSGSSSYGDAHMRACANQQSTGVYHDPQGGL